MLNNIQKIIIAFCFGIFSILPNNNLFAQTYEIPEQFTMDELFNMPLEDLMNIKVITPSKKEEPMDEAPNVMYVVTREDIDKKGFKNLKEVLQYIPGFASFLHALGQIVQVRGIAANENEKITIMLNGHIIDQFFEPIHFDGPINLDNVKRIEIIVGPGSVLYGAETLETIINIITIDEDISQSKVTYGTDGTKSLSVNIGRTYDENINFFVSGTYLERGGYDAWTENSLELGGADGTERVNANLLGKDLVEKIDPSQFLVASINFNNWSINYSHENLETPEYHVYRFRWGEEGSRRSYVDCISLKNETELKKGFKSIFEISHDNKRQLRQVTKRGDAEFPGPSYDLAQRIYASSYSIQYSKNKHFFQTGLQIKYKENRHNYVMLWTPENPDENNQVASGNSFVENMIRMRDTYSIGYYLSHNYKVSDKVKLTVATRFDYDNILEEEKIYMSPRVALVYKPIDKWILKAMFNRATRMPNTWESTLNQVYGAENKSENYNDSNDFFIWGKVNENVKRPEILTDYELQSINYFGEHRFAVNLYYQILNDFIAWNTPYTNVGNFTGFGGEAELKISISNDFNFRLTASVNNNKFEKLSLTDTSIVYDKEKRPENPDGEMLSVPKFTSNCGFDYTQNLFGGKTSYFLAGRYLTHIPMRIEITGNDDIDYTYANNRIYIDFNIGWQNKHNKFRIDLSGKNIFDNQEFLSVTWNRDFYKPRGAVFMLACSYYFDR